MAEGVQAAVVPAVVVWAAEVQAAAEQVVVE